MNSLNKTFLPPKNFQKRNWFIIDCQGQKLGRISTLVTSLLKGKLKPHYHPSLDIGDYVILINADSILINNSSKHYIVANPGRPGHSLKIKAVSDCLATFTIHQAVKGMLSQTEKKRLMKRLHIYQDQNHPHQAQKPTKITSSNLYSNFHLTELK